MTKPNQDRRTGVQFDCCVVGGVVFYPLYCSRQWFVSSCGKVLGAKGKVLKPRDNGNGYKIVSYQDSDKRIRNKYVHRLVAKTFLVGDNRVHVNHKDGDKTNNNISNLEYVTPKENTAHAVRTGLVTNLPTKGQQGFQHGS